MVNRDRRLFLALTGLLLAGMMLTGYAQAQARPAVSWSFAHNLDRNGNPHGNLYLLVSGRRVLVLRKPGLAFRVLDRAEFRSHAIPRAALTACIGTWGDMGENVYAIRRQGRLEIYQRARDEMGPVSGYHRIRSVAIREMARR